MQQLKNAFRSEVSKFRLWTSLKVVMIFLLGSLFIGFMINHFIKTNLLFFEANGLPAKQGLQQAYYDFVVGQLIPLIPYYFVFLIILFFLGNFIAGLLIRPFLVISDFCEDSMQGKVASYKSGLFLDQKFLTHFCVSFFNYINLSLKERRFLDAIIPPNVLKIRKPVFEFTFFLNLIILFGLVCGITAFSLFYAADVIYDQMVDLSLKEMKSTKPLLFFLNGQKEVVEEFVRAGILVMMGLYFSLGLSLYTNVSRASFGIFSTFRSFMKGNYNARLHLIGYTYIRDASRTINQYLKYVQLELTKQSHKEFKNQKEG